MELRAHQITGYDMLVDSMKRGNKRIVLAAPCAYGKTVLAGYLLQEAAKKGKQGAILCDRVQLIEQSLDKFDAMGMDCGVIQGQHERTNWGAQTKIISIQTLARRKRLPDLDFVIVDECHTLWKTVTDMMTEYDGIPVIGLSATPYSKGMGKHYQDLVVPITTRQLLDQGYLCPVKYYAGAAPDLEKVKLKTTRTGTRDFDDKSLSIEMEKPKLIGDIVKTWKEKGEDSQTIAFCPSKVHSQGLVKAFMDAGVPAVHIDDKTPTDERKEIYQQHNDGMFKVLSCCMLLNTGYDSPSTRCLIDARPTKSLIAFVQRSGRIMRTSPGKDCISRGTDILTDKGLVKIEDVTLDHKVWDGVSFVVHGGAICKGVRKVITYCGLTATPDHEVMTNKGWMSFGESANRRERIIETGLGGEPLRVPEDNFKEDGKARAPGWIKNVDGSCSVRKMRNRVNGYIQQYAQKAKTVWMQALQRQEGLQCAEVAVPKSQFSAQQVHKSEQRGLEGLWRKGNRVQVSKRRRGCGLDMGEPKAREEISDRPNRQQRPLRAWKSKGCYASSEYGKHKKIGWVESVAVRAIQAGNAARKVCRFDFGATYSGWPFVRANRIEVEYSIPQAKGEVWDILNAGPLQRFTANGLLVHNCAIYLDHASNVARHGFPEDVVPEELDDGERDYDEKKLTKKDDKEEKEPRSCPKCSAIMAGVVCGACGAKLPPTRKEIETVEGELRELNQIKINNEFYGGLLQYAKEKKYSEGWAAHKYKEKFGEFPTGAKPQPCTPSDEVKGYIKHLNIKRAMAKKYKRAL